MPITQFSSFFGMEISPDFFFDAGFVFLDPFLPTATADWICTPNPVELEKKNETELGTTWMRKKNWSLRVILMCLKV